jgi:MurNAc alpha-1-phosphate uridylyltransferase
MRAMILAAGRGERMRPLSDRCPKPLLEAGGRPLIVWQIERLAEAGIVRIVINHSHLGGMIEHALGDGSALGVRIDYSPEPEALETLGGIVQALPLLGAEPFVVVSGDIYTDFDFDLLREPAAAIAARPDRTCAHLVLVGNPPFHLQGDMALAQGRIDPDGMPKLTYANIGVFHPSLFAGLAPGRPARIFPWLYAQARQGRVSGQRHDGVWENIGTPQQLAELDARLQSAT